MDPAIEAAIIASVSAGGVGIVGFGTTIWTTSRTLRAAREKDLRDRQAGVYQQLLAYSTHRSQVIFNETRTIRFNSDTETQLQHHVDTYTPPNSFELTGSVLAFWPDPIRKAFLDAEQAEAAMLSARDAHAQAVELNKAEPAPRDPPDPHNAVGLQAEYRTKIEAALEAHLALTNIVRNDMLGAGPPRRLMRKLFRRPKSLP